MPRCELLRRRKATKVNSDRERTAVQAFTLARIVKALDISRAAGHAIFLALGEGGRLALETQAAS